MRFSRQYRLHHCIAPVILLLATTLLWCSTAIAADGPRELPLPPHIDSPIGSGWAIADLDGDHKADLALSRKIGSGGKGYLYRVDLTLSQTTQSDSFTFSNADLLGVNISAVDVDGDHDLDLVISSRLFGRRIGIWINDGAGSFTEDLHGLYPAADGPFLASTRIELPIRAIDDDGLSRSFHADISTEAFSGLAQPSTQLHPATPDVFLFSFSHASQRPRAPPIRSI
jgi:hypothetical protein